MADKSNVSTVSSSSAPPGAEKPDAKKKPDPKENPPKPVDVPKPVKGLESKPGEETKPKPGNETKPKPGKETKPEPAKETNPSKEPKPAKKPKEPKKPLEPQKPPGKIMSRLLLPVPFSRGGCCGNTLPFFPSCLIIAVLGLIPSLANLALILAYLITYTKNVYDPPPGKCVDAWWDKDIPVFYFFKLPPVLLVLHVLLTMLYTVSCLSLLVFVIMRKASLLRINSLLGFVLLIPTIFVGALEVLLMSGSAWIHWNFVILFIFSMIFLYSTMIVNGYDKRLQNPPKDEEEEEI